MTLQGSHNYEILSNEKYHYYFQYVPIDFRSPNTKFDFNPKMNKKKSNKNKASINEFNMSIQDSSTSFEHGDDSITDKIDENDLILKVLSLGHFKSEDQTKFRFASQSSSVFSRAKSIH